MRAASGRSMLAADADHASSSPPSDTIAHGDSDILAASSDNYTVEYFGE